MPYIIGEVYSSRFADTAVCDNSSLQGYMSALSSRRFARPAPRSTSTASPHCPCQERTVLCPQLVQAGSSGGTRHCDLIKASGVHVSHSSRNRNHMRARRWTLTFEFGVKRGDNMCGRPLCEVLPEELKPSVALFVPQLLVESPCGRRMTVSHPAKSRPEVSIKDALKSEKSLLTYRPRLVVIAPGCTENALIRLGPNLRASSTEKRMLAVFDWP